MNEVQVSREELSRYFNKILTPAEFEDYAPNGIQIEGKNNIKKIAFAVSATLDVIQGAINEKADALVVHHGLFWKHQGARTITGPWGERIKQSVQSNLNLYAYHLPLDAHPEIGNAVSLGKELKLENLESFGMYKKKPLGIKGKFHQPMKAIDLKNQLKKVLNHEILLASPDENKIISNIGIITGGANNEWSFALQDGLDAYLTGEISEYNWFDSIEAGIHFFAGGHYATEQFGAKALMKKTKEELNIEVMFIDSLNLA